MPCNHTPAYVRPQNPLVLFCPDCAWEFTLVPYSPPSCSCGPSAETIPCKMPHDLGKCPIVVHDEETAEEAGEWVQREAEKVLRPDSSTGEKPPLEVLVDAVNSLQTSVMGIQMRELKKPALVPDWRPFARELLHVLATVIEPSHENLLKLNDLRNRYLRS